MDSFLRDLKYSIRILLKSPGFSITAIAALALGIGATTAIFSIVNAVILRPLPIPDPRRFVMLITSGGNDVSSPAKFMHWRAQSNVLEDVSAFHMGLMNYSGGRVVEQLKTLQASADVFRCWGIRIVQGRAFTQQEALPNGPQVVVIGRNLWTRRFASDPGIIGKTLLLNEQPHIIIGIAADSPGLREIGDAVPEAYVPLQWDPNTRDQGDIFQVSAIETRSHPGAGPGPVEGVRL